MYNKYLTTVKDSFLQERSIAKATLIIVRTAQYLHEAELYLENVSKYIFLLIWVIQIHN